jgi:hypothetical protein
MMQQKQADECLERTGCKNGPGLPGTGSLHLAYHDDEVAVIEAFAQTEGIYCSMLTPAQTAAKSKAYKQQGLRAALWSPMEMMVDPRQASGIKTKDRSFFSGVCEIRCTSAGITEWRR